MDWILCPPRFAEILTPRVLVLGDGAFGRWWGLEGVTPWWHCCCLVARSCPVFFDPLDCSTTGFLVLHYLLELLKFMFIESVTLSNHLILCRPLLVLPSIFPNIQVFSNGLALCIRWPKYFSFSFSISLSSEYSGLISFRMDWFDLLAVQETLKSLL